MWVSPPRSLTQPTHHINALITLTATIILGWTAAVTFCGPDIAKAIDKSLPGYVENKKPVKAKRVR